MDKLKYFSGRMVQYMVDNASDINQLFGCTNSSNPDYPTSIWRKLDDFLNSSESQEATPDKSPACADSGGLSDDDTVTTVDSDSDDDSVESQEEEEELPAPKLPPSLKDTFVGDVLEAWNKRRPYLEHPYAIVGWFLSPAGPIMEDAQTNHGPTHRRTVEALICKLLLKPQATEEATKRAKLDLIVTFWKEWNAFQNKQGEFDPEMLGWDDTQRESAPHLWHQLWTLPYTRVLGKVACLVCSKLCGQGQAEREWGFTKDVRKGKRLRLGSGVNSNNLMDQVTCYAAYSVERGLAKAKRKESLQLVVTDDDYWSLGLGGLLVDIEVVTGEQPEERIVKGFVEDWESDALVEKSLTNEVMLRRKYGGLCYYNIDDGGLVPRTIDKSQVKFSKRKDNVGCYITGITPTGEEEEWQINEDLHLMILAFYRHNPNHNNVKLVTWSEYKGLTSVSDDEALVSEWIAHGGKLPKKPAPRKSKKKAPAKRKKSSASQSVHSSAQSTQATKVITSFVRKPPPAVQNLCDGSDSDSGSDESAAAPKRRKIGIRVDGGSVASDSDDETCMET